MDWGSKVWKLELSINVKYYNKQTTSTDPSYLLFIIIIRTHFDQWLEENNSWIKHHATSVVIWFIYRALLNKKTWETFGKISQQMYCWCAIGERKSMHYRAQLTFHVFYLPHSQVHITKYRHLLRSLTVIWEWHCVILTLNGVLNKQDTPDKTCWKLTILIYLPKSII